MKQFTYFAQAADYNCNGAADSSYGAGSFGTCTTSSTSSTTQEVGAPNTGLFQQLASGGAFSILLPLAAMIILVTVSTLIVRKKRANQR